MSLLRILRIGKSRPMLWIGLLLSNWAAVHSSIPTVFLPSIISGIVSGLRTTICRRRRWCCVSLLCKLIIWGHFLCTKVKRNLTGTNIVLRFITVWKSLPISNRRCMLWGIGKLRFCLRRLYAMRWLNGCPEVWRVTERRGYLAMNTGSRRYLFFPFIAEKKEPGNAAAFCSFIVR